MRLPTASDAVRARALSASISDAACKDRGSWWSQQESAHLRAPDAAAAGRLGRRIQQICGTCPLATRQLCAELAVVDRYSGFAAGATYVNGQRYDATVLHNHLQPNQDTA